MRHYLFAALSLCCVASYAGQRYYASPESHGDGSGRSWENASSRLYDLIEIAEPGDTILVANGRYYGGFNVRSGVTVLGGFTEGNESLDNRTSPAEDSDEGSILDGNHRFRVLTQTAAATAPAKFDGFVIENGTASSGAGALISAGCTLEHCVVRNCSSGLHGAGEYIERVNGVAISSDKATHTVSVIAKKYTSNLCQYDRAEYFAESARSLSGVQSRILTADEAQTLLSYPEYEIVSATLAANGFTDFGTTSIWTSTETESAGLEGRFALNLSTRELLPLNRWQYCRVLPAGSYTVSGGRPLGGGIRATDGAVIRHCTVTGNSATLGSGIHARNGVLISNTNIHDNLSDNELNVDDSVVVEDFSGVDSVISDGESDPVINSTVSAGSEIMLSMQGFTSYSLYSVSGCLIAAGTVGPDCVVAAPGTKGMYLLSLSGSGLRATTVKIVVK